MNNADVGARATEAVNFFIEAVEQIPSESWDLPSNLEGWSIRDLVAHSTGSAAKIVTLVEGGQVEQGPADPNDRRRRIPPHSFASWPADCTTPSPAPISMRSARS
jgi:hypothetical protein